MMGVRRRALSFAKAQALLECKGSFQPEAHTQHLGICLCSFLLICTVNEEFQVHPQLLLSGRTLDHSPVAPPENPELGQGQVCKGLRSCSLPGSWLALNIVPNLLPTLGRIFEQKEYKNSCFRRPLLPPPTAEFLSHIYPPTPFLLLQPRANL